MTLLTIATNSIENEACRWTPFNEHVLTVTSMRRTSEGKGHWMDREDAAALPWMARYKRNAWPKHIIWQQEAVLRPDFYWLSAPRNELKRGKRVDAEVKDNTIDIARCDYSSLTLYLSDELVNLKKPVTIKLRGKKVFSGKLKPNEEVYRQTLHQRQDPRFASPYRITINDK